MNTIVNFITCTFPIRYVGTYCDLYGKVWLFKCKLFYSYHIILLFCIENVCMKIEKFH